VPAAAVTDAVNVTNCPNGEGFRLELTLVDVGAFFPG